MAMWAIVDKSTGVLLHPCFIVEDGQTPRDAGWPWDADAQDIVPLPARPREEESRWDPASRAYVPDVERLSARLRRAIEARRDRAIHGGAETPLGRVDSDDASIRNIMGLVQMANLSLTAGLPFTRTFRLASNDEVPVNAEGMIAIGVAVGEHVDVCYRHSWALKARLDGGELELDLDAGWPGSPAQGPETPAEPSPLPA